MVYGGGRMVPSTKPYAFWLFRYVTICHCHVR
jgi:hypothetical protein